MLSALEEKFAGHCNESLVDYEAATLRHTGGVAGRLQTLIAAKPGDRRSLQPRRFAVAHRTTFKLPRERERRTR